jgi:hypothetical protein
VHIEDPEEWLAVAPPPGVDRRCPSAALKVTACPACCARIHGAVGLVTSADQTTPHADGTGPAFPLTCEVSRDAPVALQVVVRRIACRTGDDNDDSDGDHDDENESRKPEMVAGSFALCEGLVVYPGRVVEVTPVGESDVHFLAIVDAVLPFREAIASHIRGTVVTVLAADPDPQREGSVAGDASDDDIGSDDDDDDDDVGGGGDGDDEDDGDGGSDPGSDFFDDFSPEVRDCDGVRMYRAVAYPLPPHLGDGVAAPSPAPSPAVSSAAAALDVPAMTVARDPESEAVMPISSMIRTDDIVVGALVRVSLRHDDGTVDLDDDADDPGKIVRVIGSGGGDGDLWNVACAPSSCGADNEHGGDEGNERGTTGLDESPCPPKPISILLPPVALHCLQPPPRLSPAPLAVDHFRRASGVARGMNGYVMGGNPNFSRWDADTKRKKTRKKKKKKKKN